MAKAWATIGGKKRKVNKRSVNAIESIEMQRTVSTTNLMQDLMQLAPGAIQFKKDLMKDKHAPVFLKLKNADDILDRTVPKPSQNINLTGSITRTDLSRRELQQMVMKKMVEKGLVEDPRADYEDADYDE